MFDAPHHAPTERNFFLLSTYKHLAALRPTQA